MPISTNFLNFADPQAVFSDLAHLAQQRQLTEQAQAIQQQQFAQTQAQQAALAMLQNEGHLAQLQLNAAQLNRNTAMDMQRLGLEQQRIQASTQDDALRAREAATRFQAMQEFQNEIRSGKTPDQVLPRLAPSLFAGSPQSMAAYYDTQLRETNRPSKDNRTSSMKEADEIVLLDQQASQAEQSGNSDLASQLRTKSDFLKAKSRGLEMEMGVDENGRPTYRVGTKGLTGKTGEVPAAVVSDSIKKLTKYQNASELLTKLEKNLRPEDVGLKGTLGELMVDRTIEQFVPGSANKQRISNRAIVTAAREGLLREVSDDNKFSNADREAISAALPSSGAFESYADAMEKINTVKQILKDRSKNYSRVINKPVKWAMTPDEIRAATRLDPKDPNYISKEEAVQLLKMHNNLK